MKYIKPVLIVLIVIVIIIGAKFIFFPSKIDKKASPGTVKPVAPSSVVTVFVTANTNQGDKLFASGSILANEEADLHPESSGRIEYINLPEGKAVAKGTLLLRINSSDIQAQLNKVQAQLKLAEGSLARQKKLLDIEGASQQEYEQAVANLNSLKADSAFYRTQLAKTEIRAPFDGILGIRQVSIGSYVTPVTVIATISQIDPVKIDFFLPEKYSGLLSPGDDISCTTEGENKSFKSKITVKDPRIDLANRSVRFRAISSNPGGKLMPGSFVRLEINLKGSTNNIFVPTEAVIATLKGKKVFVVENGKAAEKEIETGLRTSQNIQVLSGLNMGDSVVVSGNYQLKPGAEVKVITGGKL